MKKCIPFWIIIYFIKAQEIYIPSFGSDTTLDIATWNIEWFPKRGDSTVIYVSEIIRQLDLDLIAIQEVYNKGIFNSMVNSIDGYSALYENSSWNESHGLAYIYKNDFIVINDVYDIFETESFHNIFPRSPMVIDVEIRGENYIIINNHFKCCGDGILDMTDILDDEYRRFMAMSHLKNYADYYFPEKKLIILGDLNDDLIEPYPDNIFQEIFFDSTNYFFADLHISYGPDTHWSFPAFHPIVPWPSHLDHLLISNELFNSLNVSNVITVLIDNYLNGSWSEYDYFVSDHRPVAMKLNLSKSPILISIYDVEDDTGGMVNINFEKALFNSDNSNQISYQILRNDSLNNSLYEWVIVDSVADIGENTYDIILPTLTDSSTWDTGLTEFKIASKIGDTTYFSNSMFGYSKDNISPERPSGLQAQYNTEDLGITITWNANNDPDFKYFKLEKSNNYHFLVYDSKIVLHNTFNDVEYNQNEVNYYRVIAIDHSSNKSHYSNIISTDNLSSYSRPLPAKYILHQNYPNPFNPITVIKFELPEYSFVNITIYDMLGNVISNLVKRSENSGYKSVQWNATNNQGQPVSAGVYLYSIEAGEFRATKKMILLK